MKGLKQLALVSAVAAAPMASAELQPMNDGAMGDVTGQAGITVDLNLGMQIDQIKYVDNDGNGSGNAGSLSFNNIRLGSISDFDSTSTKPAAAVAMNDMTIDVDASEGIVITSPKIGTGPGTGLDVDVQSFQINGVSAGGFEVENFRTFISSGEIDTANKIFGTSVASVDKHVRATTTIQAGGGYDASGAAGTGNEGLTIDMEFGGVIDRIAYKEDGNEIGLAGVAIFDVDPSSGEPIAMSVDNMTVDVINDGTTKLRLGGFETSGTIAINQINIGAADPAGANSIGSLLISGIDMSNTTVDIYAH